MTRPRLIQGVAVIDEELGPLRDSGRPLVLVPTMGDLHEGHLSLVRMGARLGPVVVSVFVNPTQFGPNEDFGAYPRNLQRDLELLEAIPGVEAVFAPPAGEMYPPGDSTFVEVEGVGEPLEGVFRPGHLRGVATVVTKLFLLLRPEVAVFGQKDAQQCLVVKRLVQDLALPVRLIFGPTVREGDGLAMSSRNRYLDARQREQARTLYAALCAGREQLEGGEVRPAAVEAAMTAVLSASECVADYAALRGLPELSELEEARGPVLLAVAARLGKARLIDNLSLNLDGGVVEEQPLSPEATVDEVAREWARRKERRIG